MPLSGNTVEIRLLPYFNNNFYFFLQIHAAVGHQILSVIGQVQTEQSSIVSGIADGVRSNVQATVKQVLGGNAGASDQQIAEFVQERVRPAVEKNLR